MQDLSMTGTLPSFSRPETLSTTSLSRFLLHVTSTMTLPE